MKLMCTSFEEDCTLSVKSPLQSTEVELVEKANVKTVSEVGLGFFNSLKSIFVDSFSPIYIVTAVIHISVDRLFLEPDRLYSAIT